MGWLQNIWIERQKDWIITSLLPKNTPDGIPQIPLRADEDYVTIDLASLRIVKVRNGWSKFYGWSIAASHCRIWMTRRRRNSTLSRFPRCDRT